MIMKNNTTAIEEQRTEKLNRARNLRKKTATTPPKVKPPVSFGEKLSQHWSILTTAVVFDILAIIPFISVIFNFLFTCILFLYFGSRKKKKGSEITRIALPAVVGSFADFFIGILPVNIGVTLIRIWLS